MELRFMGQTYAASNIKSETVPSNLIAQFKGQSYNVPIPIRTIKPQLREGIRKYRGVTYTIEPRNYSVA
ncbi:MAG: DUF4278 domain-containing protein [Pleurocapsa sp.]